MDDLVLVRLPYIKQHLFKSLPQRHICLGIDKLPVPNNELGQNARSS